ncbi:VOC family protein [Candidatus Poribacteria bacterium]|nr:VOC family protein [Candidatus Poribacteria bacterium]
MGYTFHHIHIRCEDLEASIDFYENVLGGKITEKVEVRGMPIVRMDVGGENIFLSPKFGDIDVESTSGNPRWGVYQLAFLVDDIDAAVEELQAKGAELEDLKPSGLPMAFFKGPDNVQIEVIEAS